MSKIKKLLVFIILMIMFQSIGAIHSVIKHEEIHKSNLKQNNFKNVTIEYQYDFFYGKLQGKTQGYPTKYSDTQTAKEMNLYTEIYGYTNSSLIFNLWLMVLLIGMVLIWREG